MNHGDVVTNEMNTASQQVAELAFRHPERNDSVDFLMDAVEIEATACREAIRWQVSNPISSKSSLASEPPFMNRRFLFSRHLSRGRKL